MDKNKKKQLIKDVRYYRVPKCMMKYEFKNGFKLQDLDDLAFWEDLKSLEKDTGGKSNDSIFKMTYTIEQI